MDIKEKAKEYAEGKALCAITSAIEEAYATGYQEGYADGYANREKPDTQLKYNKVSYIDLALPSGTKWATGYLTKTNGDMELLQFVNARNFNLPTIKQFQELLENTEQLITEKGGKAVTEFISLRNGAKFWLTNGSYKQNGYFYNDNYVFWLKEKFNSASGRYVIGTTIQAQNNMAYMPVLLVGKCDTSE